MKKIFIFFGIILSSIGFSQEFISLDVPWINQSKSGCPNSITANMGTSFCGHTCSEMVFSFYQNRQPSKNLIFNYNESIENHYGNPNNPCGTGTVNPNRLIWLANQQGFRAEWYGNYGSFVNSSGIISTLSDIKSFIQQGTPVMVQVGYQMNMSPNAHWMLIVGFDDINQEVIVNDPGRSSYVNGDHTRYSYNTFINSWSNSSNVSLIFKKSRTINDNLKICGGNINNPRNVDIYLSNISDGSTVTELTIGGELISNFNATTTDGNRFRIPAYTLSNVNLQNGEDYDISFKVNGELVTGESQFYFINANYCLASPNEQIVYQNNYYKDVKQTVELGLFRDVQPNITNLYWNDPVKRAEVGKAICMLAIKLHKINGLNTDTSAGRWYMNTQNNNSDLPNYAWAFKYIQTLYNNNAFSISPSNNNPDEYFNPDGNINLEKVSEWIVKVFGLNQANNSNHTDYEVGFCNTNFNILKSLKKKNSLGFKVPLFSDGFLDNQGELQSACNLNGTNRYQLAYLLNGIYEYFINQGNIESLSISTNNPNYNWQIVGNQLLTTEFGNSIIDEVPEVNATIMDNEVWVSDNLTSNNFGFLWSVRGGQLIPFEGTNFGRVTFIPPTIEENTTFPIYFKVYNYQGNYAEVVYNIIVEPTNPVNCEDVINLSANAVYYNPTNEYGVNLTWEGNANNYEVNWKKTDEEYDEEYNITVTSTSLHIPDLSPCQEYEFRVRPICEDSSYSYTTETTECVVPVEPSSLTATPNHGFKKVEVNAEIPNNHGIIYLLKETNDGEGFSEPENFTLYQYNNNYQDAPYLNGSSTRIMEVGYSAEHIFSGLEWGQTYTIRAYSFRGNHYSRIFSTNFVEETFTINDMSVTTVDFTQYPNPGVANQNVELSGINDGNTYHAKWFLNEELVQEGIFWNPIFTEAGVYPVTYERCDILNENCLQITKNVTVISESDNVPIINLTGTVNDTSNQYYKKFNTNFEITNVGYDHLCDLNFETYLVGDTSLDVNQDFYYQFPVDGGECSDGIFSLNGLNINNSSTFNKNLCIPHNLISNYNQTYYIAIKINGEACNVNGWDGELGTFYLPINIIDFIADIEPVSITLNETTYNSSAPLNVTIDYISNIDTNNWDYSINSIIEIVKVSDGNVYQTFGTGSFSNTEGLTYSENLNESLYNTLQDGDYYAKLIVGNEYPTNSDTPFVSSSNNIIQSDIFSIENNSQPNNDIDEIQFTNFNTGTYTAILPSIETGNKFAHVVSTYFKLHVPEDNVTYIPNNNWVNAEEINSSTRMVYFGNSQNQTINNLPVNQDLNVRVFNTNPNNGSPDYLQGYGVNDFAYKGYYLIAKEQNFENNFRRISYKSIRDIEKLQDNQFIGVGGDYFYQSKGNDNNYLKFYKFFDVNGIVKGCFTQNGEFFIVSNDQLFKTDSQNSFNWNSVFDFSNIDFKPNQLNFFNQNEGLISGVRENNDSSNNDNESIIYKTIDGGQNWTEVFSEYNPSSDGIFYSITNGSKYFGLSKNTMTYSPNNGSTWYSYNYPSMNSVVDKLFYYNNKLYSINSQGVIKYTQNFQNWFVLKDLNNGNSFENHISINDTGIYVASNGKLYFSANYDENFITLVDEYNVKTFEFLENNQIVISGNNGTFIFNNTIINDDQAPSINANDVTIYLDENGIANININEVANGTTDNVSDYNDISLQLSKSTFNCSEVGVNDDIVLVATDEAGNSSTSMFNVTVIDSLPPQIESCPSSYTVTTNNTYTLPNFSNQVSANDNCTDVIISQSPAFGTDLGFGEHEITITVSDENNNISSCFFTITVDSTLGLEEINNDSITIIYPNPFTSDVTIESNKNIQSIFIHDLSGKLMNSSSFSHIQNNKVTLSLNQLQTGDYLMKILLEDGKIITHKILKK